jgi:sterol desaturase/sphingolipid hydroxylase (fatty acid hydroxylase superfamily)
LVSSGLTALFICKLFNKPFMNPKLYDKHDVMDKLNRVLNVGKSVILNYNIVYFTLSQYNLRDGTDDFHSRIWKIATFVFILEFIAYWYHRLSHEITYIFKNSHKHHHINIDVYPIDFLEFDYIDNVAQTLYTNLPLYFIPMNVNDYTLIYFVYATSAFLSHSDILTNDHIIHHRRFKYNYSLLIPIFDNLFGTYRHFPNSEHYE